jgi:hypothetical protein
MPKPKGWSNERTNKRDELAKKLIAEGKPESNAYAIATAALSPSRNKKRRYRSRVYIPK